MEITKTSQLSGKENTLDIDVTQDQINCWKEGELIQRAMPHVSRPEREFLMSGITPKEWEDAFGEGDE